MKKIKFVSILLILLLFSITAIPVSAKVKISPTKVVLIKGEKQKLKINTKKKVKWSSKNKRIATVSKKGVVTAKKKGTTTIYATVGKKKYERKVTVYNAGEYLKGKYKNIVSDDVIYLRSGAGDSKNGNIPTFYSPKPPKGYTNGRSIGVDITEQNPDDIHPYWTYIDHIRVSIDTVAIRSTMSHYIQWDALKNGKHIVEVVQYKDDDPKKEVILYKKMYYKVVEY